MRKEDTKGAAREGKSILTGLLRCGYCSRKLRVRYSWQNLYSYYYCCGEHARNGERGCIRFSGRQLDSVVEDEIIKVLQPQAIRAAILAEQRCNQHAKEKTGSVYYALEQARMKPIELRDNITMLIRMSMLNRKTMKTTKPY